MKVLILNASPRKNGNTKKVVNAFVQKHSFKNIVQIDLIDLNMGHCIGCLACSRTGECPFNDDMQMVYDAVNTADMIVFSTPIYFNSVTSIGKVAIDRFQRNYAKRFIRKEWPKVDLNKKGLLIATAGSKEKNNEFDGLRFPMDLFFKANGIKSYQSMIIEDFDKLSQRDIEDKLKNCIQNIE